MSLLRWLFIRIFTLTQRRLAATRALANEWSVIEYIETRIVAGTSAGFDGHGAGLSPVPCR